jgi:hypothetical protein
MLKNILFSYNAALNLYQGEVMRKIYQYAINRCGLAKWGIAACLLTQIGNVLPLEARCNIKPCHCHCECHPDKATALGKKLEHMLWSTICRKDWCELEERISDIFQGAHMIDYSNTPTLTNCCEELALLRCLDLNNFQICNLVGKLSDDEKVLTVSYNLSATAVRTNQVWQVNSPTLSVWKKTSQGWRWVSHTSFGAF